MDYPLWLLFLSVSGAITWIAILLYPLYAWIAWLIADSDEVVEEKRRLFL